MEVKLSPDQEAFVRRPIEIGLLNRRGDAVQEALLLWEERERSRVELLTALDKADADLQAGRYTDYTAAMLPNLAAVLKREAGA